jgi:leucyl-tRNA synthetase
MELVNETYTYCDRLGVRIASRDDAPDVAIARPASAAVLRETVEALVRLLSPFTPHMAEELWERLGHAGGIVAAGWPAFDEDAAREEAVEIPVQVNGRVRGRVTLPADADRTAIEAAALVVPSVVPHLEGHDIVKVVVANGRLVNIVVKPRKTP